LAPIGSKIILNLLIHHPRLRRHGNTARWEREKGDYLGVTRASLIAGAAISQPEHPLEAAEEVLAIIEQHAS
jgi:hypothetical protein